MKIFKSLYIIGLLFYSAIICIITLIVFNLNLLYVEKNNLPKNETSGTVYKVDTVFIKKIDTPKTKEVTVDKPIVKKQTPVDTLKINIKSQIVKPIDTLEKINNVLDSTKTL